MNVHDSGKIAAILCGMGCNEARDDAEADIILFNTCTVRDHAHHKAISEIGRAITLKKRRPDLIVGVCGCVAQEEKARLFEIYPELDLVFGPDQIHRLPELLAGGKSQIPNSKIIATELIDDPGEYNWTPDFSLGAFPTKVGHPPITAFITIMKGCNNSCSFCIVPSVRGREVSRPADDILAEVKILVTQGIKEVTLLGQNVNSYNRGGISSFVSLLKRISAETDIQRIRYTSPHPKDLGDDLIEEHVTNPKLCRHMHLPLQAGSDKILRAMKRSYNKQQFIDKTLKLRKAAEGIDITTDIIVGFPGETEKDFRDTLDIVREVAFDGMFAFKYSPRPGTKAAELKDDVAQEEKEDRLARLLELNAKIWKEKTEGLIGGVQQVLVENISKRQSSQLTGRTFANKIVNFSGNLDLIGHIVNTRIIGAGANSLKGELKT